MATGVFHVKHEASPPALPTERAELLDRFEGLLRERALPGGLISAADGPRLRERHLVDSLRAAGAVRSADRHAYDLGSGAGLPGLVVAIARPSLRVTLVERRQPRAAFLEWAADQLGLENVHVVAAEAGSLAEPADLAFARALASPAGSWALAAPLLRPAGRLVYYAGSGFEPERDVPPDVYALILTSSLAPSGPLVIMTRQ
jgi:16S rRNA (guanine527-N7)-methyltransferase